MLNLITGRWDFYYSTCHSVLSLDSFTGNTTCTVNLGVSMTMTLNWLKYCKYILTHTPKCVYYAAALHWMVTTFKNKNKKIISISSWQLTPYLPCLSISSFSPTWPFISQLFGILKVAKSWSSPPLKIKPSD